MLGERDLGSSIRAFFESDEGRNLFRNCPIRQHLSHLQEFETVQANHILLHMLGHILDYKTGEPCHDNDGRPTFAINQDDIGDELRYVYNDSNNPKLNEERRVNADVDPYDKPEFHGFGPERRGCHGADARAELMAEAFRAYMENPNYLKSTAWNVGARIRSAVNSNPSVNTVIQFN